jgi:ABC-type glycerol-3-phosphate transport system substrate-binding protein
MPCIAGRRCAASWQSWKGKSALLLLFSLSLAGCGTRETDSNKAAPKAASRPEASLTLRVLVVNNPELATAIDRLRGEWAERATGELQTTSADWADIATANSLDADVVVFSSRHLGELCVRGWLRPVRTNVLGSDDFNTEDLFPLVRRELMKWGGQVMAVPLGARLVTTDTQRWPLGLGLLARAAPHVVTRERVAVLFDLETMKPRIAEPEFVEALEELVESNKPESSAVNGDGDNESSPDTTPKRGGKANAVPVIGHGDRLAAVTTFSRNAANAFRLLEWLASADISSRLGGARAGLLPVRRSLATSAKWYPEYLTEDERTEQANALREALSSQQSLVVPRLPGVDKYLAVLDSEVKAALDGRVPPQVALERAAQAWERITDAKGRDKQRDAYLKHLGIVE